MSQILSSKVVYSNQQMSKVQKRFLWVDVMRVTAIYAVILVHTSTLPVTFSHISDLPFFLSFALVKVCVPLFVMLSGALLLGKQEPLGLFFGKRAVKVLIPWILWTLIYMAWNYTFHGYHPANVSQWKYFFELTFFSQLWFLPLIFSLYIITPILRLFVPLMTKTIKIYFSFIWFVFVCLLPFIHTGTTFPRSDESGLIPVTLYYSGYFILGYFLSNIKLPKKSTRKSFGIVLIGLAITFLELLLIKQAKVFDYFAPGIVITSIGVFILLFSYFSKVKIGKNWERILAVIGNSSLGIYIVHGLLTEYLRLSFPQITYFLNNLPLIQGYYYALVLFFLSFFLVLILKKIPGLKLLVP
jgi:surface polysaccharide O-acyltransferase-like enzyme